MNRRKLPDRLTNRPTRRSDRPLPSACGCRTEALGPCGCGAESTRMTYMTRNRNARAWTLADAKAHFSEVVDSALEKGPQVITRHGRKTVVVVAADEWERRTQRKGSLADFFAASPLRESGLVVERSKDIPRELDL